jgi:hypothetical protein
VLADKKVLFGDISDLWIRDVQPIFLPEVAGEQAGFK